jgi:hypothetical protein
MKARAEERQGKARLGSRQGKVSRMPKPTQGQAKADTSLGKGRGMARRGQRQGKVRVKVG